jgi:hypothetical protein
MLRSLGVKGEIFHLSRSAITDYAPIGGTHHTTVWRPKMLS